MVSRRLFMKFAPLFAGAAAATAAATTAKAEAKQRVAYHVSDLDKVGFCIGNIANHIKGMGGPENVEIVLVAHGPALKAFHQMDGDAGLMEKARSLMGLGVAFNACGNTMRALSYEDGDLLQGMVRVDQGGVVRLAQLQAEGYLYLRP